ncbi:MAG: FG-GAP repeat domain-containing protein [Verrucomicrobiales bacterium]
MIRKTCLALALPLSLGLSPTPAIAAEPKFQRQVIDDKIAIGYGLAIGDVDGDKKPDIILADKSQIAWYRNGDWKRFNIAENVNPPVRARHFDNVCIAARDIDGDGKVEIAIGGQWNPGETSDASKSGSVHYLARPADPTQPWKPIRLHHEPTVHRMHWVRTGGDLYKLVVLPLHGRGNQKGEGDGVRVLAYDIPEAREDGEAWKTSLVDDSLHLAHNFDLVSSGDTEGILIAGKEGALGARWEGSEWISQAAPVGAGTDGSPGQLEPAGEIRVRGKLMAAICPMHGNSVVIVDYGHPSAPKLPVKIDESLNQGHALAIGDVLGLGAGQQQVIAGWRNPDKDGRVGIKLYKPEGEDTHGEWETHLIDDNGMACEDLKLADLDGDGKQEIIAAGRATKNVVIYWNKN